MDEAMIKTKKMATTEVAVVDQNQCDIEPELWSYMYPSNFQD